MKADKMLVPLEAGGLQRDRANPSRRAPSRVMTPTVR